MAAQDSIKTAAQASWMAPIASFAMNHFIHSGKTERNVMAVSIIIVVISISLYIIGLSAGLYALANIKKVGKKGVLIPAMIGVVLNAAILSMFVYVSFNK